MHQPTLTDSSDLPQELCTKPLVLVGLSGLDTLNNAVHKSIWDIFTSNRRIERAPVLFKLIDNAHEFPVVKPKRNSYEWYIPKGILKRNWMNKYLSEVPAVIVVFYDLDWNDTSWNEKMIECASRVQSIRAAVEGRNTKITVVLIQSSPLPAGEDMIASERATALCASCDLNPKSLFVLPNVDHLQGYAVRLENAFYDLAQNFYHSEARNIKSHRDHLNKTIHQYLFVRHQFKMGFLNELRQDNHTAHKHYTHAYNNLLEIRIVDTNANEIRTVAGYINYKLCKLMFILNLPRDAISQFRSHIDRFKNRIGFKELSFEHYSWLSKQYAVFGDIFDEAVKQGLPAVQTQHPGLYYQQAAQYAIYRRQMCDELCIHVTKYPSPDPLEGSSNLEFYGQRPWRPGKLSTEPPDPHLESSGIVALQYNEKQVNHSYLIITLYGLAITQYKMYRCPRTRRHLVVLMAEEYFNSRDYGKALTLFTHMLWDYRAEKWWDVISNILTRAIKCAFLTASIQDFFMLSLEALSDFIKISSDEKRKIYENILRICNRQIPEINGDLPIEGVQQATALWGQLLLKPINFQIDMGTIACCIDVKCKFLKLNYEADENISIELFLRSLCAFPQTFSSLSVIVTTPGFSTEVLAPIKNGTITISPGAVERYKLEFTPDPNDVGKEIQISSVHAKLSTAPNGVVDLKFAGTGNDAQNSFPELQHFARSARDSPDFDNVKPATSANIVPRHSKLEFAFLHENPSLLGEWYEIVVKVKNNENYGIQDVKLDLSLADDDGVNSSDFSLSEAFEIEKLPLQVRVERLEKDEERSVRFYMRSHKIGERTIRCGASFLLASAKPIASLKEENFNVSIVKPFEVTTKFLSSLFENITKFYVEEEMVIMLVVNNVSPWPITIDGTHLEISNVFENVDASIGGQLNSMTLKSKECGTEIYLLNPKRQTDKNADIGQYTVKWKRDGGFPTVTETPLTGLQIEWIPLDMKLTLPEHGFVRTPLLVRYHFLNKSHHLLQLDINVEGSEAFMYAGFKQFQINILPDSEKVIEYNLYPLIAGSVVLPKFVLSIPENSTEGPSLRQDQLSLLVERATPKFLFVMPQVKGNLPKKRIIENVTTV